LCDRGWSNRGVGWRRGEFNWGPSYGTGGYVVNLDLDREKARQTLLNLYNDRFFDSGTRAIMLQFVVYNTNTRQLTNVRLLIEVYMSSDFQMTYTLDTAKIVVYQSRTDDVRCDVVSICSAHETHRFALSCLFVCLRCGPWVFFVHVCCSCAW
jgi:hypothetical protein